MNEKETIKELKNLFDSDENKQYDVVFKNGQYFFKEIEPKKEKDIYLPKGQTKLKINKNSDDENILLIRKKVGKSHESKLCD